MFLLSAQQCPAPPAVEPAEVLLRGEVEPACDAVSGLLNREAFLRAADRLGQAGQNLAVLTLDIERFTELNEHFGLGCGDFLLCQLGLRCEAWAESLSGRTAVGRVGADEFAIAWLPLQEEALAALQELAADLHSSVSGAYELGLSRPLAVEVQVGVATMKADARQAAETLLHATVARQGAQTGRGRVHRYETHAVERRVGQRLHDLVQERRFAIALQPKVELRTGKLSGFEALARWPEGAGEIVAPDVFIPQAERLGLINQLGDCVLEQALQWQRALPQCVPVAVNFSAPQFARHDLIDHLLASLERHALPPGALELELTETVLLDDAEAAVQTLARLRELGLKLAIDDFGTGYSSLSYLCRFSVDRLKLDRSFVARLCDDARTQALVRSVIAIAHELGLQCVAEGIETREQLAMLIALGCDEGQGYLLSRPLDPAAAHTLALGTAPWQSLLRTLPPPVPAPCIDPEIPTMRKTGHVTQQEYLLNTDCTLVSTTDLKSRITYCNPAFIEASGYEKDELIGQPHNMIRHPDMPQEAFRDMWETIQSGLPWSGLVKNRRKNGDHYWVLANVTPTLENGQVIGYISVRTCPSRDAVRNTEALYAQMRQEARDKRLVTVLKQGQVLQRTLMGRLRRATQWQLATKLSVSVLALAALAAGLTQVGGMAPTAGLLVLGMGTAWWLRRQAVAPLTETIGIANRLAAGDVGQTVSAGRNDETGMLKRALSQLKVNLQALVGDVREQVEGIEVASQQISAGSSDLSSRTETQASNLQQTAASLEQISGNVQNNSRSAEQANALAERARSMAAESAQAVAAAVQRMEDIQKASARIAEITQVVDALSFQTNLLSLNAAVEAARAGDAGRGFAVVASEVRALAQRTRDASKEIKQLIEASVAQVSEGARSVEATGRSVEETRLTIDQVSTLVGEISIASKEQAQGVEQVHQAVAELDSLTQQNAAMVEELSAAAASLSTQAAVVASAVKIFRA